MGQEHSSVVQTILAASNEAISIPDCCCNHYDNKCDVICPDCGRKFPCRRCHDENVQGHVFDRFRVEKIVCRNCGCEQPPRVMCKKCETIFAKYFCEICNLFDDRDRGYYHCFDCRECKMGGPDNFFHCTKCDTCLSLNSLSSHKCIKGATSDNCPICLDNLSTSGQASLTMKCGHNIHVYCYGKLQESQHGRTCPICRRAI